jgi:NADH dehydrogenase
MRENKIVAVIGGTGFIGRNIVEQLAREGMRIKILTRNADRAKFLKPMGEVGQIVTLAGNALDEDALRRVMEGADAVVNTVGILAESGTQRFKTLQAELPGRIGEIATEMGIKSVVQLSAIGANEHSSSKYARTKAMGEIALFKACRTATILRLSLVFGAGDGFFNRFASMAVTAPALPLIGGGRNKVQPIFVGDVAAAVLVSLNEKRPQGKIYELGGPDIMTFREVMSYILIQIKRRRILLPVPFWVMGSAAMVMSVLPNAPVTRDQLKLLKFDNVVAADARTLEDLKVTATSMELIVPSNLERYQPGGRFAAT